MQMMNQRICRIARRSVEFRLTQTLAKRLGFRVIMQDYRPRGTVSTRPYIDPWRSHSPAEAKSSTDRQAEISFAALSVAVETSFKAAAALNDLSIATDRTANMILARLSEEQFASAGTHESQEPVRSLADRNLEPRLNLSYLCIKNHAA